jgi:branched-chain amino acid transport system ATP-binding protein
MNQGVPSLLVVEDFSVTHGRVRAVRGATFSAAAGELVAVVGPNGAGKSSLLAGLIGWTSSAGRVMLSDRSVQGQPPEAIVRQGMTLVPEGRRVFGELTVEENLVLGCSSLGRASDVKSLVDREMERFPALGRLRSRQASKLSGGEQQQLSIARALMPEPTVLMLDEPSFGLAPRVVEQVLGIVVDLARSGVTVLLVEQNALAAIEISDRAYSMHGGVLAPLDLSAQDAMAVALNEAFLGGTS